MEQNNQIKVNITHVTNGKEARDLIKKGVDTIANAVKVTLGARGKNVCIEEGITPHVTKDGVTVANAIFLSEPIPNMGAMMVRQAANRTVLEAGDGTTTSTVLAQAMVEKGMDLVEKGGNPVQIQRQMLQAAEEIVEEIERLAEPITDDKVRSIALISANGDEEVGNAIAEAYLSVGEDGVIAPSESKNHKTYTEVVDGIQIKAGYINGAFINRDTKAIAVHENVNILVCDQDIDTFNSVIPALNATDETPLVIIAREFSGEAMAGLADNFKKGLIKVLPVIAPGRGEHQREYLEDIAIATGATYMSPRTGISIEGVKPEHFGGADEVKAGYRTTTILGYKGDKKKIEERMERLKVMIEEAPDGVVREAFQERLGRLKGKISVLYVGASSPMALKEKADRVDDALGATQAAMAEGIVPGGGAMLNWIGLQNTGESVDGKRIVYQSCLEPMAAILKNGGIESFTLDLKDHKSGIDVTTGQQVDMVEEGIIDPAKVVKCCIRNAASVAGAILTTECTINNKRWE